MGRPSDNTEKTEAVGGTPVGELIPQPHGGALRNGGTNKGGPGRPRSEVRALCLDGFERALPEIIAIAKNDPGEDGTRPHSASEQMKATEMLGKFGLGTRMDVTSDERPLQTYTIIADESRL